MSNTPNFTTAQTNAMNARGRALLVSAAAGSGKTFTLTRRIIDSIINDESKTLSRMLIVTFTRSAAAELKKKISDALSEALAIHPDNAHLQNEILHLGSAHISTIDSFFMAPVKANFEKLGLPASLRLADEAELSPLRDSIFKDTLEIFFNERSGLCDGSLAEVGHFSHYTDLLSLIIGIRDSSKLIPTLISFYTKTLTVPGGVELIKKCADRLRGSAAIDFFDTLEGEIIRKETKNVIISTAERVAALRDQVISIYEDELGRAQGSPPAFALALKTKVAPALEEDIATCKALLPELEKQFKDCRNAINSLKFGKYPTLKDDNWSEYSDSYRKLRLKVLQPVKDLKSDFFCYTDEQLAEHYETTAKMCELLYDLLSEFDRRYSAEKLSRGVCEFSDMPKFMLKLLQNEDGSPTELAISMSEQYDEVYIDEYQDVNAIQDRIFEIIGGDRRFMVGDIKQSIYCFRDAEPSIFASYRMKFPEYDEKHPDVIPDCGGNSIFMSENFRCDQGVIDFVNKVCDVIFSSFADSIGYNAENDMLRFNKKSAHFDPAKKVIINIVEPPVVADGEGEESEEAVSEGYEADENEDKLYDEAVLCANEIARLIRDKNELNADGTPVRAGDIAILVRGHKQIDVMAEVLSRLGIKYVTNAKNELLSSNEMKLLADILTIIDNPREDIPLCRVLSASLPSYSPIMSLDDVVTIRSFSGKEASFFDALSFYAQNGDEEALASKCESFITSLDSLRRLSARVSADKLLRAVSRNDTFASLCETDAYTYLYNHACKYVKSSWNGLYSFITYFKSLMEKGDSNSDPIKAQRDEVTIITMHQSKGLEYNVCFLFGLGKEFNVRDLSAPIIFNRELGISMKLPKSHDDDDDVFSKTQVKREENIIWRASTILAKNKLFEEEARIFYVAMTRARERLYLSATLTKPYEEIREKLSANARDLMNEVRNGKSYIRWTMLALLSEGRDNDLFEVKVFPRNNVPPLADRITREEVDSSAYGITEEDKDFAKALLSPHGESEEEKLMAMIPAKVAASKVSPTMLDDSVFIPTPTGDLFSDSDEDKGEQSSDNTDRIKKRIELMRSRRVDFESLLEVNKKPTAAEKGSAAHLILQYCDYEKLSENGLDAEIERLVSDRFITRRVADIVNREQLSGFFSSRLFDLILNAKKVRREFRFGLFRSAADFTAREELKNTILDKKIFVQGSIDLLIETDDGIILCDYKTDRISDEERADRELLINNMREKHAGQLEEYRFAVRSIFGEEPIKTYIYSVPLGEVVEI